jgi:hypothetical protein
MERYLYARAEKSSMPRGRPTKSQIRQNLVEILAVKGTGYGYELARIYNQIFQECTRENIYYHLRKGVALGEFVLKEIRQEKGEYSWGSVVEKKIYAIGPNAKPQGNERIKKYFEAKH